MPPPRQPTTREIAAACGYSQSAVSHALRGNSQVAAATKRKILAAARKLGWRPNPLAAAYMAHLRSTRRASAFQATLALLIPGPFGGRVRNQLAHLHHYYEGASERAKAAGYVLETIGLDDPDMSARRLGSILTSRGITGLIIPGLRSTAVIDGLDWRNFTAVTLAFASTRSRLHRVAVDAFGGITETINRLHGLGYTRIGVVVAESYDALHNHGVLFPAYYMRNEMAGRCAVEIYRFPSIGDEEIPGIQTWLKAVRPDVVIGHAVAKKAIEELGWRIPQDIAFASVDRAPEYPEMAGFDQRHAVRGAVAAELLIGQVVQNERGFPAVPRVVLVPGVWADGASVPRKAPGVATI